MLRPTVPMGKAGWRGAGQAARVVDLIGFSRKGFQEAVSNALSQMNGDRARLVEAEVKGLTVRLDEGQLLYRADLAAVVKTTMNPGGPGPRESIESAPLFEPEKLRRVPFYV